MCFSFVFCVTSARGNTTSTRAFIVVMQPLHGAENTSTQFEKFCQKGGDTLVVTAGPVTPGPYYMFFFCTTVRLLPPPLLYSTNSNYCIPLNSLQSVHLSEHTA